MMREAAVIELTQQHLLNCLILPISTLVLLHNLLGLPKTRGPWPSPFHRWTPSNREHIPKSHSLAFTYSTCIGMGCTSLVSWVPHRFPCFLLPSYCSLFIPHSGRARRISAAHPALVLAVQYWVCGHLFCAQPLLLLLLLPSALFLLEAFRWVQAVAPVPLSPLPHPPQPPIGSTWLYKRASSVAKL